MEGTPQNSDRTSPDYLYALLDEAFAIDSNRAVVGVYAPEPPNDFRALETMVESSRNSSCAISHEVDKVMEIIATLPDRDAVAASLPYDPTDQTIVFIIPGPDKPYYK